MPGRWVPRDFATRSHLNGCPWCGWYTGNQGQPHKLVSCLACGVSQCMTKSSCAACLHGWLPGWSRGMGLAEHKLCGYAGCSEPAVAEAPRIKRVCSVHLSRATVGSGAHKTTLAVAIEANRQIALGEVSTQHSWRRMTYREPA